jgi:ribose 5-phosphate isomerase B
MKIAVSTDELTHIVEFLRNELLQRGHEVLYFGPAKEGDSADWPDVTIEAVTRVKQGDTDEAIVLCWTGAGCSIAANKVPGIRAALCNDAETAKGARVWNHANVLALSLRTTSEALLKEILDAWFGTPYSTDEWNVAQMVKLRAIEDSNG